jgi:hypothetical protein
MYAYRGANVYRVNNEWDDRYFFMPKNHCTIGRISEEI